MIKTVVCFGFFDFSLSLVPMTMVKASITTTTKIQFVVGVATFCYERKTSSSSTAQKKKNRKKCTAQKKKREKTWRDVDLSLSLFSLAYLKTLSLLCLSRGKKSNFLCDAFPQKSFQLLTLSLSLPLSGRLRSVSPLLCEKNNQKKKKKKAEAERSSHSR